MEKLYEKLDVWQQGIRLALIVYNLTHSFPADEKFGMVSQISRISASIPYDIAKGTAIDALPLMPNKKYLGEMLCSSSLALIVSFMKS